MNNYPICDVSGLIYILLAVALTLVIIVFVVIILLETIILWRLKWGSFIKSLGVSLGINIVSGAVGYFMIRWLGGDRIILFLRTDFWRFLVANMLLTICIEGSLLVLLKRDNWLLSLKSAIIINIASYIWNAIAFQYVLLRLPIS